METYDQSRIGKLISWTSEHSVYHYGEQEVIKFSRFEILFGKRIVGRIERDLRVTKEFLGPYVLETRTEQSPSGTRVALIQPFVRGEYLRRSHMRDPGVAEQFADIAERHTRLIAAHYAAVDFLGQGGCFSRCLSNIWVIDERDLKIIDTMLADPSNLGFMTPILRPITKIVLARQRGIVDEFLCAGRDLHPRRA